MQKTTYFLITALLTFGCTDLFSTRQDQVEKPKNSANFYADANSPDVVVNNFTRSVKERNFSEYLKLFSNPDPTNLDTEPFEFIGAANFSEQIAGLKWGYDDEEKFATSFLTDNNISAIQFEYDPSLVIIQTDELAETEFFGYTLTVTKSLNTIDEYSGQMQLKLYRSENEKQIWYIYEWTDEADGNSDTISILKIDIFTRIQ